MATDRQDAGRTPDAAGATPPAGPRNAADPDGHDVPEELKEDRKEVGSRAESARHPPHVSAGDEDAKIQDDLPSPEDVPVMPSTASGTDKTPPDEQHQAIDDESMYDRRPEEDKDQPPSERED